MALLDKGDDINVSAPKAQENNSIWDFSVPFYISLSGYSLEREDKMYDIKKTGEIIKKLRLQKGKTQECVAEEMGINIKTYRAIENGIRGGSVDTLCVIAQYFKVTIDYLIYGMKQDAGIDVILEGVDSVKREKIIDIIQNIVEAVKILV